MDTHLREDFCSIVELPVIKQNLLARMAGWLPQAKLFGFATCFSLLILLIYNAPTSNINTGTWKHGFKTWRQISQEELKAEKQITEKVIKIGQSLSFKFKVYTPMRSVNQATFLRSGCSRNENTDKFIVITGFINLTSSTYRKTLGSLAQESEQNDALIEARHMEVIDVLNWNLDHTLIGKVHVLVRDLETAEFLHSLPLQRSDKLVIRVVNEDVGLKCQLLYAARCLPGQLVAITNQDNKIGRGWDLPWHRVINDSNTMYALTRHSAFESNCTTQGTCDDGDSYFGSHDTFVFKAKEEWTEKTFSELNQISPDLLGMENLFIWFFRTKMNYRLLNPCKALFVHHHHCVAIRGVNRKRVNVAGKSGLIGYSNNLER